MKKNLYITLLIALSALLSSSCSVYEEVTFLKDGRMSYNMTFDGGEFMKMLSESKSSSSGKISDSIISLVQVLESEKMDMINGYPELKNDIENIRPLFFRTVENHQTGEFKMSIFGDFKDADAFNKAFKSMVNLASNTKDMDVDIEGIPATGKRGGKDMIEWLAYFPEYQWDGKTMKRTIDTSKLELQTDDKEPSNKDPFSDWKSFFQGGKMGVKYHFPQKVNSVDNPDALLSQDGKTVIIEYPASVFTTSPQEADIEIKLK
jgi:hypothetical protein